MASGWTNPFEGPSQEPQQQQVHTPKVKDGMGRERLPDRPSFSGSGLYDIPSTLPEQMQLVRTQPDSDSDHQPQQQSEQDEAGRAVGISGVEADDAAERILQSTSQPSHSLKETGKASNSAERLPEVNLPDTAAKDDLTMASDDPMDVYQKMLQAQGLECPIEDGDQASSQSPAVLQVNEVPNVVKANSTAAGGDSDGDDEVVFSMRDHPAPVRSRNSSRPSYSPPGEYGPKGQASSHQFRISASSLRSSSSTSAKVLYSCNPPAANKALVTSAASPKAKMKNSNGLRFSVPSGFFSPGGELKTKGFQLFRNSSSSNSSGSYSGSEGRQTPNSAGCSQCDCKCGKRRYRSTFESLSLSPVGEIPDTTASSPGLSADSGKQGRTADGNKTSSVDDHHRIQKLQRKITLLWVLILCLLACLAMSTVMIVLQKTQVFSLYHSTGDHGIVLNATHAKQQVSNTTEMMLSSPSTTRHDNCPNGWTSMNRKCWQLQSEMHNWTSALSMCQKSGGQLASVSTDAEGTLLRAFAGVDIWIWTVVDIVQRLQNTIRANSLCPRLMHNGIMDYISVASCSIAAKFVCTLRATPTQVPTVNLEPDL